MTATAADVRSILSIQAHFVPSAAAKKQSTSQAKKPEGISRELYSLIGPSAPSLAAQLQKPQLKQKPRLGSSAVRWEWRKFRNGARGDSLELGHWVKATADPDTEYPFSKYNVQTAHFIYSQDEYSKHLEVDPEWTKDETDYLFNLVREYDQRWHIISDRYDYPGGPHRVMEDLKERFCNVCRRLVRDRPWAGDEASRVQLISTFMFDKERELIRKRYLANLDNRTPREAEEEEALYLEVKRIEQNERKFKRDREELLRTLAGIDSGLPDIVEDELPTILFDSKKKKKGGLDADSPSTPVSAAPPKQRPQPSPRNPVYDALHCITHIDLPVTTPATKAAHQPSFLRTYKLPVPKAAVVPKISQTLAEINISYNRLVMPTEGNVARLNALIDATLPLVETKRVLDKVEYDIKVLKERLNVRSSAPVEEEAGGVVDAADGEAIEGTEEGRAQSVVSTRSTRSRKQRRSVSVSSVDTTGAGTSRPPPKRQRRN
ncbi:uncharacterized protein BT62DRAFT_888547 [Guyanagaster necrorhizus]|uniref:SWR1-complex protein 4 n=1 Tax=Guyanagaster necrorhizus TaxID=856835 RepID=A0A9P7VY04_9AGAR|nr:uncharacterized protein BT62DRAFT_888547 [Guyanagaster necrorhizus MCA 3950]KAG7449019.1 hypothetical protein BT62DRAFT_888547 [Guyanagaster necrorhizus MCA 3950]